MNISSSLPAISTEAITALKGAQAKDAVAISMLEKTLELAETNMAQITAMIGKGAVVDTYA